MEDRRTVLICEDDPIQLKILEAALSEAEYDTLSARSPAEAVQALGHRRVDAVLSDVNLVEGSAFDILGSMRRAGQDAPMLMISAHATPALQECARAQGITTFLEKPIALPKIVGIVDKAVHDHRAKGGRILVVEDHPQFRARLEMLLTKAGFEVVTAENGSEALERLSEGEPPDLALVDMHLPGLAGPALVDALRRKVPGLFVSMMTGEAAREEIQGGYQAGAVAFIRKPIKPEQLIEFVRRNLRPAREMRHAAEQHVERERRRAAEPWHRRAWRRAKASIRGNRRKVMAVAAAASLVAGILGAAMLDRVQGEVSGLENRADRALERLERRLMSPGVDDVLQRMILSEQMRQGQEVRRALDVPPPPPRVSMPTPWLGMEPRSEEGRASVQEAVRRAQDLHLIDEDSFHVRPR